MGEIRKTVRLRSESLERLRGPLEKLFASFDASYLDTDPLRYAHRFSDSRDREMVAFVSALLAFGGVKVIFRSIEKLLSFLGPSPVMGLQNPELPRILLSSGFKHRWISVEDVIPFFEVLRRIYRDGGTLESFFLYGEPNQDRSLEFRLDRFVRRFREELGTKSAGRRSLRFLLPSPPEGSACKRFNLFLRWVVRSKPPDLGLWTSVRPSELYLPIDVHLGRILTYVGLTKRKVTSWRMVREVTEHLRLLDPEDPVRFDFALSRLGILDLCLHRADEDLCPRCSLQEICVLNQRRIRLGRLTKMTRRAN